MGFIVFPDSKAVCLFFVISLVLAASEDEGYFITQPKNKEIFVGEDVQFDWEYARTDVQEIHFGVVLPNDEEMSIYIKKIPDGTTIFNNAFQAIEWIRDRVEVVPNRRASFKINRVQMEDTGTYYCTLGVGFIRDINKVRLNVVDLLIDKHLSTQTTESWLGRKITVKCAVRLPPGGSVKFSWMHIRSNRTVPKEFHDDTRSKSYLTMTTNKNEDFEALQCRAETISTVKFHIINITKLSPPSKPRNLEAERSSEKQNAQPSIRLYWDPPKDNGGAVVSGYIISYMPCDQSWKSPITEEAETNEFNDLNLPGGNIYGVNVRAKNKAGVSPPSNEVEINLEDIPNMSNLTGNNQRHRMEPSLLLLSFVVCFL